MDGWTGVQFIAYHQNSQMTYLKWICIEVRDGLSGAGVKMASSQMHGFVWKSAWDTKRTGTLLGRPKMVGSTPRI